jgi:hypothetical protein
VIDEFLGLNDVVGGKNGGENVLVLFDLLPLVSNSRGTGEGTLHVFVCQFSFLVET